ncbi:MAG: CDP-alcohol phosphatidyltransferase family protein [Pseudomonadota bacterium]
MEKSAKPINVPNMLTVSRILMTPLLVILLLKQLFGPALGVFVLAGITDALDGLIARYCNQRTELGAYLDPIADKLLLTASFISLGVLNLIPGWVVVIVITRDVLILLGIAIYSLTGITLRIAPSMLSKCTTAAQLTAVGLSLLGVQLNGISIYLSYFFWLTAGLTTLSGLHYIYVGMSILQSGTKSDMSDKL